jgi:hypothetical protein
MLAGGQFRGQEEALRLYRRLATMDPTAPIPALPDMTPSWDRAAALARDWELTALSERLAGLAQAG